MVGDILLCETSLQWRIYKPLRNSSVRVKIQPWPKVSCSVLQSTVLLLECLEFDLLSLNAMELASSIQWQRMATGDCWRASKEQLWWERLMLHVQWMNHAVKENYLLRSQSGQGGATINRPKACDGFQRHFLFIICIYLWNSRYFELMRYWGYPWGKF